MSDGVTSAVVPTRLDRPIHDPLFDRLFPPLPTGVHWGLERVDAALDALGRPERSAPVVHVGGTNGKGSVCSIVASILGAQGVRTGLYTSPHLVSLTERFQVDGRAVEERILIEIADEIRDVVVTYGLTFFEAMTVLGFSLFRALDVAAQVVEVGLGGRLDATNVVTPAVSLLTNVADDHAEFLGHTIREIAGEKGGILKPGVPAWTTATDPAALEVFRAVAARTGAPLGCLDPREEVHDFEMDAAHDAFTLLGTPWGDLDLETPLIGAHQAANVLLAVYGCAELPAGLRPEGDAVRRGVARARWPGRDDVVRREDGTWLFDVAHNAAGIESLVGVLDRLDLPNPRVALVGVLGDKDWRTMLPPLLSRVHATVLTQPPTAPEGRCWDPHEALAQVGGGARGHAVHVVESFETALAEARSVAGTGTVIVTGSCHTVGDAMRALGRVPFASDAE
ncbi:MAG: Mur ligase family protein [Longimicrobiales bacterium]|nr:Mur ligase family protein [Longimicrobiales bacterium]